MKKVSLILMMALISGILGCAQSSTLPTPEIIATGKRLVEEHCKSCHSLEFLEDTKSRSNWEKDVDRMIEMDVELNKEERQAVIDYLANK